MKYKNATLEGRGKLLIIGILERNIRKIKQQTLFTIKTRSNKKIVTISILPQIKTKTKQTNLYVRLVNRSKKADRGESQILPFFLKQLISQLLISLDIN